MSANTSPPRAMTLSIIAWLTCMLDVRRSGSASMSLRKLGSPHETKPSGAFLRTSFRRFFTSSPARSSILMFSVSCSGACATTVPAVSYPARPARPAIWWNSRALSCRIRVPSYLVRPVKSTVRMGTLIPTPRVSVPQITRRRPCCASCSTSRRYFGSMPAWCTPIPARTSRDSVLPNAVLNRKPPMISAISSRCSRVTILMLDSACARSRAAACAKCTM